MRRSKNAKTPREAKKLREQAHAMRREERAAAAGKTIERIEASVPTLKSAGVAKAAQPGWTIARDQLYSDDMDVQRAIEANTHPMEGIKFSSQNVMDTFNGIFKAVELKESPSEAFDQISALLRELEAKTRSNLECDHIETLRRVHESNAANVVRSYMALIDGLGHANGGPVPPYVVIPGLMAVRVYDALQKAGHSPDGN